jgi:secreted PhoX family phosphatase
MYFIDELDGGNVYKFTSAASWGEIMSGRAEYFAAGQTFVLRVGDGSTPNATGAFTWVPITDATGAGLPGTLTVTDTNGVTSVDGQTIAGREYLYMTTTSTHQVYRLDLSRKTVSVFVDRNTIDLATGMPVGSALASPDNLALDHDGNIYVIEDRNGGSDGDIWFAADLNQDGDLNDPGEGIGRWASNGTPGSEFTGLYFDPTNKRRAWVNIQHPSSGNDRTIELTIP